jgi:signal transduction histidine kinase
LGVDHQVDIAGVLTRLVLDDRQQFRGILQALPVGTLFADMMGEVQLINDAARRVLEASSYHFFPGANLPTLIGELTGRPAEEISAALFATYTTDEPSVFRWETTGAAPRTFRMPVRPVADARADQENDDDQSSIRPTPLGYLCVIEDVTASRDAQRGMLTVLDTLTRRAEGHVSSLHRVGKMLLAQADLPLESAGHVSQMLTQADVLVGLIEEFASALGPVEGSDTGVIPVDPAELAAAVVDEVGGAMSAEHRLKLRVHGPITPVLMDRTRLARGLYRILYDSLINSPADAVTTIEVTEDRSGVFLEVRDEGYGIPDAVLKQLDADSDHPVDPADGLARVVRDVRVGGGQLAIDSRVGRGTSYRIRFSKRVKVSDLPTGPGSDDP